MQKYTRNTTECIYVLSEKEFKEYTHLKKIDEDTLLDMTDKNYRQWCSFLKRLGKRIQDNNNILTMSLFIEVIEDYPQVRRWFYEPEKRSLWGYRNAD